MAHSFIVIKDLDSAFNKKKQTILFRPDISFMLCFAYSFSCFHLQSYRIRFRLSRIVDRIKVMRYAVSMLFALCEPFFSHTQMKSRAKEKNEFKSKRPNADEIRACDKYLMVECDEKSNKNCRHFIHHSVRKCSVHSDGLMKLNA